MLGPERSVLHVLPHPGGGGETYVDLLEAMPGYRFSRVYLASSPRPTPSLCRSLVEAARGARRNDLLHVHGEVAAGLCLPLLATGPSVVTLHGLHLVRRLSGVPRRAAVLTLRAVLQAADRTICVSQSEHDELVRIVGAAAGSSRAVVIRNGVPLPPAPSAAERSAIRRELGISQDDVVAIWVGSLDGRKDPLAAVRAAREAGVTMLVVGDGPLRSQVEREAGERVHVLGQRADVPRLLAASDFYMLISRREGLALSLLEAMAAGLAPIVSDVPENVEAVGATGFVIPRGDVAGLTAALERLRHDASERRVLGGRAKERANREFGLEAMVRQTREVYEGVVRPGGDGQRCVNSLR
jgi:glycosyltransferase involved in cell wall biosynthesis